jgi:hypothetical protein
MDVCVCLSGADGRVVEGRATLFRHHLEVRGFKSQAGWASHGWFVLYFVLCCPKRKKGEERLGVGGRGKYPGAQSHIKEKKRGKNKPTARYGRWTNKTGTLKI